MGWSTFWTEEAVRERFALDPRTDDWDEFVSIDPPLSDEAAGKGGGTSRLGASMPFFVVDAVFLGLRRPLAFGADATRRKKRAAEPIEDFGLVGIGPPAMPLPSWWDGDCGFC